VVCPNDNPTAEQTSKLARRIARDLKAAGWRLERVLSDNGNEFRGPPFVNTIASLKARHSHIHAGRAQTNGNVEALHKTILDECWRAFARYLYPRHTGLRRELDTYPRFYNFDRVHHGRLTGGQIPADIVYGARKIDARRADPVGTSRSRSRLVLARRGGIRPTGERQVGRRTRRSPRRRRRGRRHSQGHRAGSRADREQRGARGRGRWRRVARRPLNSRQATAG
jgi:hypothetical protein